MADGNAPLPDDRHAKTDAVWQPRAPERVEQSVAQYSRFVARMKVGLPVAAGMILLLVLVLPQIRSESERFRIGLKNVKEVATDTLSWVNARYFGTTIKGEPFQVTAAAAHERAEANEAGTKLIDLSGPKAEITMVDGRHVKVAATTGVYDRKEEVLDLGGQVDLSDDQGFQMHTSAARVRLKDSIATGDAPVTAKGDFGDIQAAGFTVRQHDRVLQFKGPATLKLKNKDADTGTDKPAGGQP